MPFNCEKCRVLHLSRKKNKCYRYKISDSWLISSTCKKRSGCPDRPQIKHEPAVFFNFQISQLNFGLHNGKWYFQSLLEWSEHTSSIVSSIDYHNTRKMLRSWKECKEEQQRRLEAWDWILYRTVKKNRQYLAKEKKRAGNMNSVLQYLKGYHSQEDTNLFSKVG